MEKSTFTADETLEFLTKNDIINIGDYSGQLAHALKRVQRMGSAV